MDQDLTEIQSLFDVLDPVAGPWRALLVREHLDPEQKIALRGCSKGTKELVLRTARQATVTPQLDNHRGEPLQPDLQASRLSSVSRDLRARGQLPTKVALRTLSRDTGHLTSALVGLQDAAAHVNHLEMISGYNLPRSMLETVAHCCPNLTTLVLSSGARDIPHPSHLPQLRTLSMWVSRQNIEAARNYLPQLTDLDLNPHSGCCRWDVTELFRPATTTTTLRTLNVGNAGLSDCLLGLLLECAPALEELTVPYVSLQSTAWATTPCNWQRLTVSTLNVLDLTRIPLPAGITVTAETFHPSCSHDSEREAVPAAIARFRERGATLVYDGADIRSPDDEQADEAASLRRAIEVLQALPAFWAPEATLQLTGWTMSAALMHELQGLPCWSTLSLMSMHWLSDPLLHNPLLSNIPDSFGEVSIKRLEGLSSIEQLEQLCISATIDRTAEHPLIIELHDPVNEDMVDSINQRILQETGSQHVILRGSCYLI